MTGHRISHAHNLSKRRWIPNLQKVNAIVDGKKQKIRVCSRCIRSGKVVKAPPAKRFQTAEGETP